MLIRRFLAALAALSAALLMALIPTPAHATGTWVWSRPIPHIYQDTPYNCVPASFTNQLASAGGTVDSTTQDTLATQFQTKESDPGGGTQWPTAAPVLNNMVGPHYVYDIRYATSGAQVMTEVRYEIDTFQAGLVAGVVDGQLPYVNDPTDTSSHAILIYGYNLGQATDQNGAVYAWDPWTGRGYEWLTADQVYAALQSSHGLYEIEQAQ